MGAGSGFFYEFSVPTRVGVAIHKQDRAIPIAGHGDPAAGAMWLAAGTRFDNTMQGPPRPATPLIKVFQQISRASYCFRPNQGAQIVLALQNDPVKPDNRPCRSRLISVGAFHVGAPRPTTNAPPHYELHIAMPHGAHFPAGGCADPSILRASAWARSCGAPRALARRQTSIRVPGPLAPHTPTPLNDQPPYYPRRPFRAADGVCGFARPKSSGEGPFRPPTRRTLVWAAKDFSPTSNNAAEVPVRDGGAACGIGTGARAEVAAAMLPTKIPAPS